MDMIWKICVMDYKKNKYKTRVGINVVVKVISLKEQDQEFLTNKTILSYLGGVR